MTLPTGQQMASLYNREVLSKTIGSFLKQYPVNFDLFLVKLSPISFTY
jgi:hypothetical protein